MCTAMLYLKVEQNNYGQSKRHTENYNVNIKNNSEYHDNRCSYVSLATYVDTFIGTLLELHNEHHKILFYESLLL